jgi:hypothetical protein
MPVMIRPSKKASHIAYALIGKPANMKKRAYRKRKIDDALLDGPSIRRIY